MNSSYLKACLVCWLRFKKQISIFATEAGKYNSDILFTQKSFLHEIEIKISIQDFKADFKKKKHFEYKDDSNIWAPSHFWFAIPSTILPQVQEKLKNTPYGILLVLPSISNGKYLEWHERVKIVKKAAPLHKRPCEKKITATIIHRLASELCSKYISSWK
jgi:hypothetical protein